MINITIDMLSPKYSMLKESVDACECRFIVMETEGGDKLYLRFSDLPQLITHVEAMKFLVGQGS